MLFYTVCKYRDDKDDVTFNVLAAYSSEEMAVNKVIELAQKAFDDNNEGETEDETQSRIELEEQIDEVRRAIADIEAKLSETNDNKLPFIETIPLQQELSQAQYEYTSLMEERTKIDKRVPVFRPKEKGWNISYPYPKAGEWKLKGSPNYVYPSDAIVDAGCAWDRYCAFEVKVQ